MPLPALVLVTALVAAAEVSKRSSREALLDEAAERAGKILQAPMSYEVGRDGQDKISVKFKLEDGSRSDFPVGLFVAKRYEDGALISHEYAQAWEQAGRPPVWRMMFAVWE